MSRPPRTRPMFTPAPRDARPMAAARPGAATPHTDTPQHTMNLSPLAFLALPVLAGAALLVSTPATASGAVAPSKAPPAATAARAGGKPGPQAGPAGSAAPLEAAPQAIDMPLSQGQLDLSDRVLLGDVDCEMKQRVSLWPLLSRPGHFELRFGKSVYTLVPHETTTGAVRLEDATAGVVWLQIPVKSMLLDARKGQRLVDGCVHAAQRFEQVDAAAAPPTGPGLGITGLQR